MQTFLCAKTFEETAKMLDRQRLGKQRLEAYQILQTLYGIEEGWKHHPAIKMWCGYEEALIWYFYEICREWVSRGYKNSMPVLIPLPYEQIKMPEWYTEEFINSHRSNLLRKSHEYYDQFNWNIEDTLPYLWPVR